MNASLHCPECGKPLPAGSDHCPACLIAQAMASRTLDADPRQAAPPLEPEEIAGKFPQFEILECLGRGGMGVVYKARQKSLNRLVAIKILAPERERDARFAERFAREAELLAKLSHPHIVTIHDFGETGGLYYLVMEFINGVNVRDLLREGRMPAEQALAIVPPICDALQFAHDHGIVHRDIKPENILLDREGRVKIADFGIATLAGDAADRSGTPAYMAPEQADHAEKIDHRADIYALGVVLYEMLTGERPTASPVAPSQRVQVDVRLDEVVLRALEGSPERRYQTASDFRTGVETVAKANPPVPRGEWQLRCTTCHSARSLASAGGIRIGAASVGKRTLAWCRSCGGLRFAAIERAGEPFRGNDVARGPAHGGEGVDYRSKRTFLGLPLVHVASGTDPHTGNRRIAVGWLAVGDAALGFFSFGGVAMGVFSFGGVSIGLLGYGGVALGLVAIGGLGVGLLGAFAGLAVGGVAVGGLAVGYYAHGGSAVGEHLLSPAVQDPEAIRFFKPWAAAALSSFALWNSAILVLVLGINFGMLRWAMVKSAAGPRPPSPARGSGSDERSWWKLLLHFAPAILLVIAWFTSGLERGAVLILSVVIVAVLVIRAVARGKEAPQSSDTTARWALGTLVAGLFGTPLLLSFTTKEEGVLIFGGACLLASLVLAIVSWKTRLGKGIALLWGGLIVAAGLMMVFWSARNDTVRAGVMQQMAEEEAKIERIAELAREAEVASPPTFIIEILDERRVALEGKRLEIDGLDEALARIARRKPQPRVILKARSSTDQSVVTAILEKWKSAKAGVGDASVTPPSPER